MISVQCRQTVSPVSITNSVISDHFFINSDKVLYCRAITTTKEIRNQPIKRSKPFKLTPTEAASKNKMSKSFSIQNGKLTLTTCFHPSPTRETISAVSPIGEVDLDIERDVVEKFASLNAEIYDIIASRNFDLECCMIMKNVSC